jgi:hypothetical protein
MLFGSEQYISLLPTDKNELEKYLENNPYKIFNDDKMKNLSILFETIMIPAYNELAHVIYNDIKDILKNNKSCIIYICTIIILLIFFTYLFYIYPVIHFLEKNISKIRKMVMIIPREILCELLRKEQEKEEYND